MWKDVISNVCVEIVGKLLGVRKGGKCPIVRRLSTVAVRRRAGTHVIAKGGIPDTRGISP